MENVDPTRPLNPTDTTARPPSSAGPTPISPLDKTQAIEAEFKPTLDPTEVIVPVAGPSSADVLLSDAERRKKVEQDLARLGMSPDEIHRLIKADAHTVEAPPDTPTKPAARMPIPTPAPAPAPAQPGKPQRPSAAGLQSYAAELMAKQAMARTQMIKTVAATFPEFRPSTPQERIQADALLREASMLRRRERYAEAEAKCREGLNLVPRDAAALELLGDILQGIARTDEALAAYKRAVEADAKRSSAERKYADLLTRQQTWSSLDEDAYRKNPFAATLLSALLPGAGQFHNGDWVKGVFFLLLDALCVYLLAWSPFGFPSEHGHKGINMNLMGCAIFTGIVYIMAVWDANVGARRANSTGPGGW